MFTWLALLLTAALQLPSPGQPDVAAMVDALAATLQRQYIDADVAREMADAIRTDAAVADYATLATRSQVAASLTRKLQDISRDKHLRVFDSPPSPAALAARPVVGRAEVLAGNIGYIEIPSFAQPPGAAAPAIAAAMRVVAETSALIIDVRGNGGGSPATVALVAAYLLEPGAQLLATIENRSQQSRNSSTTPVEVDGPRYGTTRPAYVLIDRRSASAAESLAYFLQARKRATVVGEQSAGAANPGGLVQLPGGFAAFIPTGRVTNPITGGNWEGTGVTPDVPDESAGALARALAEASRRVQGGKE